MDYDEDRIYYSHQNLQSENSRNRKRNLSSVDGNEDDWNNDNVDLKAVRRHFREFLRNYRQKQRYLYRDRLLRMHQRTSGDDHASGHTQSKSSSLNNTSIEVDLAHVGEYDASLLDLLLRQPAAVLPSLEAATADALKTLLYEKRQEEGSHMNEDGTGNMDAQDNDGAPNDLQNENSANSNNYNNANQLEMEELFHGNSIQLLLRGNLSPTPLRSIQSQHMNSLLRCPGIVISASKVRSRSTNIQIRCSRCQHATTIYATSGPFGGVSIPQRCMGPNPAECGPAPYAVVPDNCTFVDQQTLKLQEAPEAVPTGEMPRSVLLAVERTLVDKCPPGTRVCVLAIASLFTSGGGAGSSGGGSVKSVYLRVVGIEKDSGTGGLVNFSPREEEAFRLLAQRADVFDILSRSIAPSISGSYTIDIKKALCCQLFSGSRKKLPDGMKLRGDINVLLLGDPSMAKSQFLKYAVRVAPVGVYTSGKGSSAAGLTASVVRDQRGEFYLEGGAMVLADGGVVAIDEFDKMRPADRVAIHEAMEQQTISVAKAGITTVLNSRSSVLAAANPVFGRYDDLKSASENIDLMTTILSRFDLIFLVRDVRNEELDKMICHHVMGVHISNSRSGNSKSGNLESFGDFNVVGGSGDGVMEGDLGMTDTTGSNTSPEAIAENAMKVAMTGIGELDVPTMKKYVQYCKAKCSPRLSEEAGDILASSYVKIRDDVRRRSMEASSGTQNEVNGDAQTVIPITVRQLEALVRISESLAKMRLELEVQAEDVAEALRLFKVSTMAANSADKQGDSRLGGSGNPPMMMGVAPSRDDMLRSESFLKSRLVIGTVVNKQRIVEEAASQGYNAMFIAKAMSVMVMRGEIQERNQSRLIKRVK